MDLYNFDPRYAGMCFNEGGGDGGAGGNAGGTGGAAGGGAGGGGGNGGAGNVPPTYDEAYVTRLRGESTSERTARIAAEAKVAEYEKKEREAQEAADKAKGDYEKIAKDKEREAERERAKSAELQRRLDRVEIDKEIKTLVDSTGMLPDAAAKLEKFIDMDKVTLGADGKVQGAQEQIEALKTEMPFLFKAGTGTGSAGNGGAGGAAGGGDGRSGGAGPARGGNAAPTDHRNREAVTAAAHKSGWDSLGQK